MVVFLISPARCGGPRATQLAKSKTSVLGAKLRAGTATLGEVMTWLSALYFRGKLTYAERFSTGVLVIAPGLGLRPPSMRLSARMLAQMGKCDVESAAFTRTLAADARALSSHAPDAQIVLLGSIATGKYVAPLLEVFGERLLFPGAFVGRGDMSRGGLLLRAAKSGEELAYVPVQGAILHGERPPKLPRQRRTS